MGKLLIFISKVIGIFFAILLPIFVAFIYTFDEDLYVEGFIYKYLSHSKVEISITESPKIKNDYILKKLLKPTKIKSKKNQKALIVEPKILNKEDITIYNFSFRHLGGRNIENFSVKFLKPEEQEIPLEILDIQLDAGKVDTKIEINENEAIAVKPLLVQDEYINGKVVVNKGSTIKTIVYGSGKSAVKVVNKLNNKEASFFEKLIYYSEKSGPKVFEKTMLTLIIIIALAVIFLTLAAIFQVFTTLTKESAILTNKKYLELKSFLKNLNNRYLREMSEEKLNILILLFLISIPFLLTTILRFSLIDYLILFLIITRGENIMRYIDKFLSKNGCLPKEVGNTEKVSKVVEGNMLVPKPKK